MTDIDASNVTSEGQGLAVFRAARAARNTGEVTRLVIRGEPVAVIAPCTPAMPGPQQKGIDSVLSTVAGKVFRAEDGEVIVLLDEAPYAVAVGMDGNTSSAYLVTVPPVEIAAAMDADEDEIGGWSTGWEC